MSFSALSGATNISSYVWYIQRETVLDDGQVLRTKLPIANGRDRDYVIRFEAGDEGRAFWVGLHATLGEMGQVLVSSRRIYVARNVSPGSVRLKPVVSDVALWSITAAGFLADSQTRPLSYSFWLVNSDLSRIPLALGVASPHMTVTLPPLETRTVTLEVVAVDLTGQYVTVTTTHTVDPAVHSVSSVETCYSLLHCDHDNILTCDDRAMSRYTRRCSR